MLKLATMVDVETFIERATKIADRAKKNPDLSVEARQEARLLLEQVEEYLSQRLESL
jgi:hypothetical protein